MKKIFNVLLMMVGIFVSGVALMVAWNINNLSHHPKFVEFMLFQGISFVLVSICTFIESRIIKN